MLATLFALLLAPAAPRVGPAEAAGLEPLGCTGLFVPKDYDPPAEEPWPASMPVLSPIGWDGWPIDATPRGAVDLYTHRWRRCSPQNP